MSEYIIQTAMAVFIYMNTVFVIALIKKDNSIVDIAWGLGFILVAAFTLFREAGTTDLQILVSLLVLSWGLRLAVHVFFRNRGQEEDWRYANWRKEWGRWFLVRSYFQVFLLQGLLLSFIAYPILLINSAQTTRIGVLAVLGTLIWVVGFYSVNVSRHAVRHWIEDSSLILSEDVVEKIDGTIQWNMDFWNFYLSKPSISGLLEQSNAKFASMDKSQHVHEKNIF